jgi:hypothetical protein
VDRTRLFHSSGFRVAVIVALIAGSCVTFIKWSDSPSNTSPIWLTGFGALLASFVALFGEAVRNWIWRPNLTVSYVPGLDYCEYATVMGIANGRIISANCHYFRLLISNTGPRRAEKVEVLVTNLRKQQPDGSRPVLRRYSMNLRWTHIGTSILDGISSHMERFCDIGHSLCPQDRAAFPVPSEHLSTVAADTAILSLDVEVQANRPVHLLEPGTYELGLLICAANHRPIRKLLEIDITGAWSDNVDRMVNDGIRIRLI